VEAKPHIKYKSAPPDLKDSILRFSQLYLIEPLGFSLPSDEVMATAFFKKNVDSITSKRRGDMKPPLPKY